MYKIAVIGDKDSVLGFKAVGMDVFFTGDINLNNIIDDLVKKEYAVIFIVEELLSEISDSIEKYYEAIIPAIIPIPSNRGTLGIGMKNIKNAAEKAIGVDILFNDK